MNLLIDQLRQAKEARPRRKRVQHEHGFQETVIKYCVLALPKTAVITSIDHASAESDVSRALKAARGVLPDIPDILITYQPDPAVKLQIVAWMETKTKARKEAGVKGGQLKTGQKIWRDILITAGHHWCAPRTLEDVASFLSTTGIPLRVVRL